MFRTKGLKRNDICAKQIRNLEAASEIIFVSMLVLIVFVLAFEFWGIPHRW